MTTKQCENNEYGGHKLSEVNHPNARFFYVSLGVVCKLTNAVGYGSCTSVTTYGSYPNKQNLINDMSENGKFGVSIISIQEMKKHEFKLFVKEMDTPIVQQTKSYPAKFTQTEDGFFVVSFVDVPEAITQGSTLAEAIDMAKDALLTAFDFYTDADEPIPPPSKPSHGDIIINV